MSEETKMTPQTEPVVSEEKVQPKKTSDSFPRIEILKDEPVAEESESFADILYDQITSVISGDNPNQFFCMGLPGTLLDPAQYSYDTDKNQVKPAHVKANESKLADKLFDAAFMSSAKYKNYITGEDETIDTYENGIR